MTTANSEILTVSDLERFEEGSQVMLDANVKSATIRVANNNSKFMDVTLGDKDNEVSCKIWGVTPSTEKFIETHPYLRVQAKVNVYQGKKQLIIAQCFEIPADELDIQRLKKTAPESVDGMVADIEKTIEEMEDEVIRSIVSKRWYANKAKFIVSVAAKTNHHNYETGLLYHTTSMLRTAKNSVTLYPHLNIDTDIVYGAIILHDMDKIREYSMTPNIQVTELGKLYGHIFMSGSETYCAAKELYQENPKANFDKVPYLIHCILAHHGNLAWGSPVEPQTLEAAFVHQIDMLDSRMNMNYNK